MIIGIPKEIMPGEKRVSATPETVQQMCAQGWEVLVEKDAGEGAFYHDAAYIEAGAAILEDCREIYAKADLILKVKEPQFHEEKGAHEIDWMRQGQYLITFIHPAAPANHRMVEQLAKQGVTALTLDGVPRITRAQNLDALTSMSTCAGYKGILLAANYLPHFMPQIFTAVGMIKPTQTLVLGSGVGGLQAIATARRLGSVVYAGDIRPDADEQARSLGAKSIALGVSKEDAVGEGGYAKELSEAQLEAERAVIAEHLPAMDIVFCSALVPGCEAPILVTREMLKLMKPGSVLVDISIDQGGNCACTPPGTVEVIEGVTLIGIKNLPGLLPKSATWMFAQNIYNFAQYLIKDGQMLLDRDDEIVAKSLCTIDGQIVHEGTLEAMRKATQ